ncbi:stage III sporulation protein AA [Thermanaerosceptrum fracticalcis]|nr:stage III sporulation protein AA [Thermanaerosceptrum fracticalcis]
MTTITISKENKVTKMISSEVFEPNTWLQALPNNIRHLMEHNLKFYLQDIEEIRMRIERPLLIRMGLKEVTVDPDRKLTNDYGRGYLVRREDIEQGMEILSQSSLYAWEDELKNGYLTIPGGHRVGIVGKGVLDKGRIKTLKEISGLNYRIGREVPGCADKLLPSLINEGRIYNTLIISPPQCGKTTLLRDVVRQLSDGIPRMHFSGVNVGLVDERSEIAGMYQGQPQFLIGLRTDVLDACPKAQGMMMLIRSMSPRVVATDEIGREEDIEALYQALQAGVNVITTVHGHSLKELQERPVLKELLRWGYFERLVFLSRRRGVGTIEAVWDGKTLERMSS